VVLVLAVLGPLIFGAAALGAPLPRPLLPAESSPLDILVCLDITLALTAVPMLCAAFALRRAFAATARWRSALVGAGCGLFAGTLINVHCPNVSPFHLTLGHAVPVLLATVLGAVLMTRWLRA
ncbi:MAG TPA: NrsF family protein, partial [Polyangiaceae bacterium]